MKHALALRGVTKAYGKRTALAGLDLTVPKGAISGFIGPNGAGKTTAFSVIAGLVQPDGGEVDILGTGPFRTQIHSGMVTLLPQDSALGSHLTVTQALEHLGRLQGMSAREARKETDARLDDVDLRDRASSRISTLSHGMRRRVQVAQALLGSPSLVLLDEPTNGLDPHLVARMRELLASQRGRRTLVVSSHVLSELEAICDHVAFVEHGKITAAGPLESFTRSRARVRVVGERFPVLDELRILLPDVTLEMLDGSLVLTGAKGTDAPALNAQVLPALLAAGVRIKDVIAGETLEEAYLRSRTERVTSPR